MTSSRTNDETKSQQQIVALRAQIETLEMNQAFQEESLEAMERTVAKQHLEIQNLEHKMMLLSDYLKMLKQDIGHGGIKRPEEEVPPPHY